MNFEKILKNFCLRCNIFENIKLIKINKKWDLGFKLFF